MFCPLTGSFNYERKDTFAGKDITELAFLIRYCVRAYDEHHRHQDCIKTGTQVEC